MGHVRADIRAAVVTALTGLTTTGSRVLVDDQYPVEDVPALVIKTSEENAGESVEGIRQRAVGVSVEAVSKLTSGITAQLDQIALEVETALAGSITVGGRVLAVDYLGTDEPQLDGGSDRGVGRMTLRFRITAFTAAASPGTLL
jgi:hypothetical protein